MSTAGGSVGELSYGSFYLSTAAFGYLSTQSGSEFHQYIANINVPLVTIDQAHLLYILYSLTVISFLGAIQAHGIARTIYGPDGPPDRPKHGTVQIQHQIAIVLGIEPERVPIVPCRIAQRGLIPELLSYTQYLNNKLLVSLSEFSPDHQDIEHLIEDTPPRHRLEIGIQQLDEFYGELRRRMVPRVVYFIPMGLLKHLTWLSFLSLAAFGVLSSFGYAVILLFLAHVVLLFRKWFWLPIPSDTKPDAVDDRFTAEYKRAEEK
jgi:hypothetical protein